MRPDFVILRGGNSTLINALIVNNNFKKIIYRYKVFTTLATTKEQLDALRVLYLGSDYDFWTSPNGLGATDIMAAPEQIPELLKMFGEHGMEYTVKFEDVET